MSSRRSRTSDKRSTALVLFDIDGTLMRGAGAHHKQALIEGIRRVTGHETHLDGVATSGMLDRDLILGMLRASGQSERAIRGWMRRIVDEAQEAYAANCAMDLAPFLCKGVRGFLAELTERGAVLGIVSGNLSRIGWRKMELAGVREFFSVGAFAEDGRTRAKIARRAAQRARARGLAARNARVSLIGDHGNDVAAAKANGFQAIAVATGVTPIEELRAAGPDILVRDLTELEIDKLLGG